MSTLTILKDPADRWQRLLNSFVPIPEAILSAQSDKYFPIDQRGPLDIDITV